VGYELLGKPYILDIGINRPEVPIAESTDFWYSSRIKDQGDLSTYYGYETFNATGYMIRPAMQAFSALKEGYAYVRIEKIDPKMLSSPFAMHLIGTNYEVPELQLEEGVNPTFLLEKDGKIEYAVINGFLIDLKKGKGKFKNTMIYR